MKDRWLLVTAGFSSELNGAAIRVESQALDMNLFDTLVIDIEELFSLCPEYVQKYRQYLTPDVPGFGYFGWKPAIINAVLNSDEFKYNGVIWVDAGCEIFPSPWTRNRLKTWMQSATKYGFWGFSLDTPERLFTKKKLFENFPSVSNSDETSQIQATYLILYGPKGRQIASKWYEVAMLDISLLDFSKSNQGEDADFIEHRSDQSILSLTAKSMGLMASGIKPKPGLSGVRAILSASTYPIWSSRNRTSNSIVPKLLSGIGLIGLRISSVILLQNRRIKEDFHSIRTLRI